jgi:hypothetical protein
MVTKNEGDREGHSNSGSVGMTEGYFKFERVVSLKNLVFPFPLATAC